MKADLYICGVHKGQIEVGENSIVALLMRGQLAEVGQQLDQLKAEIEACGAKMKHSLELEAGEGEE
jgi:hypothetical protein